eukprot:GHRR01001372.1.p1 GENE.GHRR01001372.1~~GHRR01001372.1.p1  ORF type:complete len:133 (+),score=26.11 GHRR01001372.1:865-1263(+)
MDFMAVGSAFIGVLPVSSMVLCVLWMFSCLYSSCGAAGHAAAIKQALNLLAVSRTASDYMAVGQCCCYLKLLRLQLSQHSNYFLCALPFLSLDCSVIVAWLLQKCNNIPTGCKRLLDSCSKNCKQHSAVQCA